MRTASITDAKRLVVVSDTHSQPHANTAKHLRALAPDAILHGANAWAHMSRVASRDAPVPCAIGPYQMLPSSILRSAGEFAMNAATPTGTPCITTASGSMSGASTCASRYVRSPVASRNGPPFIHFQISSSGS